MNTGIEKGVSLDQLTIDGENFFRISNVDKMRPFFMSIVSSSNHWMFISSNTGLTAGRKNAQFSFFPYYTDDKITESADVTGSKSIFRVEIDEHQKLWEPFSIRQDEVYHITRNLYKNTFGNKVIFEEINNDLQLTFRTGWSSSDKYGFIKTSAIINDSSIDREVQVLDGVQNILPNGVPSDLQNASSNLVDAYKRSELVKSTGLGIFALSAIIVDRPEPSEALKANIAWSLGTVDPTILLSSRQLDSFRKGKNIAEETDVKAEKGAYFVCQELSIPARGRKDWFIVCDVNKTHNDIAALNNELTEPATLVDSLQKDIEATTEELCKLVYASDGLQRTSDYLKDARHFSNTLFNIMRGGVFDENYQIERSDFGSYMKFANKECYQRHKDTIDELAEVFDKDELNQITKKIEDPIFQRLCLEYLPLKFSRRHGDPSRPWNVFSINTKDESTGKRILDYEGNWRDIFQNWEALAYSYPKFVESMIHKFLNATTFDGYNPYRVTKGGFDWETIEEDDPWSYIGYWGDHQIIYLLKFLEFYRNSAPDRFNDLLEKEIFVYANVPYRIKPYEEILKNPKDTILFKSDDDQSIRNRRLYVGSDGALLSLTSGDIYTVSFIEKMMATSLAKISNYIPEGGIWLNTQRPEWNDANNALVGNGLSMVTLYYLRRFFTFFEEVFSDTELSDSYISAELYTFFIKVKQTLQDFEKNCQSGFNDSERKGLLDGIASAASDYRSQVYDNGFSGSKVLVQISDFQEFIKSALTHFDYSIRTNRRKDNLYHAYNLLTSNDNSLSVSYLYKMLEGQVAVISSGNLSTEEVVQVLDAMRASNLFREDQNSYLLYPEKRLPLFREKNTLSSDLIDKSTLLKALLDEKNSNIITRDINGEYHFNGAIRNANDLTKAIDNLDKTLFGNLIEEDHHIVLSIYEEVFNHKSFTGRSGTFFGYEGLGSIYWHMVSKLQLAVLEACQEAHELSNDSNNLEKLISYYYQINDGLGVHKSPELYGAFPTDPYSHTPGNKGAQQPGMTGQVKEDILSRFGELGVSYKNGSLCFSPFMLKKAEFVLEDQAFSYCNVNGEMVSISLPANALCFTICQTPVIYQINSRSSIDVVLAGGSREVVSGSVLDETISAEIFGRTGVVDYLVVHIDSSLLL